MKDGADARTQLELALVKGARPEHDPSLRALLARLERLEARPPAPPAPSRPGRAAPRSRRPPAGAPPAPSRRPRRPPRPSRRRGRGPRARGRRAAVVAASAEVDGAPAGHRRRGRRAGRARAEPEVRVGVELDLTASPSCGRPCSPTSRSAADAPRADRERPPVRARRRRAHAQLGRVRRVLQAQGGGPGLPRADRDARSARSPAARCGSPTRSPTTTPQHGRRRRPPLSEDELIDALHARVRRRGASSRRGVADAPAAQPQRPAPAGAEDAGKR